jgi:phosphomannomutase
MELEPEGYTFVYGFEEALGYTVGKVARDKDGVGTALVIADLASWCRSRGLTLVGYLEEVQRAYGLFLAKQTSFTLPGASGADTIKSVMQAFRAKPPDTVGAHKVSAALDYEKGVGSLPKANVVAYELESGSRITLRPSGTEPKLKVYFEHKESIAPNEPIVGTRARGAKQLDGLEAAFLELAFARGLPKGGQA